MSSAIVRTTGNFVIRRKASRRGLLPCPLTTSTAPTSTLPLGRLLFRLLLAATIAEPPHYLGPTTSVYFVEGSETSQDVVMTLGRGIGLSSLLYTTHHQKKSPWDS